MWEVVTVELFDKWFLSLKDTTKKSVLASVHVLEIKGPQLGRPHVDTLEGTKVLAI